MAIAAFTLNTAEQRFIEGAWGAMATGDTGAPVQLDPTCWTSVHTQSGTIGGATITWQGSLDPVSPTNWDTIPDIKGTLMTQVATGIIGPGQPVRWIRPSVVGGVASGVICRLLAARAG